MPSALSSKGGRVYRIAGEVALNAAKGVRVMVTPCFTNRQWIYAKRPSGRVTEEHYELKEAELNEPLASNEVLVKA
ncbi:MAG: hypothetical protein C0508_27875, partial [Cyanobacteria bacterium PR.023]|nr:hypothetical protein [Cyanobacteria bacterium PR.023]